MPIETEIKYTVPDRETMGHVAALAEIAGHTVEDRGIKKHTDIYFDTRDFRLFRGEIVFRLRLRGNASLLTFKAQGKSSGNVLRRIEVEEKTDSTADDISRGLLTDTAPVKALFERMGNVHLSPSLRVENNRHILLLTRESIQCFELALDDVTFSGPKGTEEVLELEVESLAGEDEELRKIGRWLAGRFSLVSAGPSKYIHGMELVGGVK